MDSIASLFSTGFSYIGPFFVLLGLLIFVHELGHFLVAKFYKVRVETFSLGFGKKLLSYKKGDTTYCISLIPLGGYVKMYGDDPTMDVPDQEKTHSFLHKPVGQRIAIVLAGPLMNLFFAAILFASVAMLGEKKASPVVGDVKESSAAYEAGFRSGDKVLSLDGTTVATWDEVKNAIEEKPKTSVSFEVERDGQVQQLSATPTYGENDNVLEVDRQVGVIEGLNPYSRQSVVALKPSSPLLGLVESTTSLIMLEKINGEEVLFLRDLDSRLASVTGSIELTYKDFLDEEAESKTLTYDGLAQSASMAQLGLEKTDLYLYQVKKNSPAEKAGFKAGDRILSLNSKAMESWETLVDSIKSYEVSQGPIAAVVQRGNQQVDLSVTPEMTELTKSSGAKDNRFTVGIIPAIASASAPPILIKQPNLAKAVVHGWKQSWVWTKMVALSFVRMIQNEVSSRNIGGILTIGKFAGQSYQVGLSPYLKLMAIISINLFLLNLLPVPVLDGGHLVFFTIEAIRGAPVSLKKMEMAQQVGLIILMSLMVFAFYNDIANIINPPF